MCFVAVVDVAAACAQTDVARRVAAVTSRAIHVGSLRDSTHDDRNRTALDIERRPELMRVRCVVF